jgi:hypothetical protein
VFEFDACVVNCQLALVWLALRSCSQASISSMRVCLSGMRRSRHWDDSSTRPGTPAGYRDRVAAYKRPLDVTRRRTQTNVGYQSWSSTRLPSSSIAFPVGVKERLACPFNLPQNVGMGIEEPKQRIAPQNLNGTVTAAHSTRSKTSRRIGWVVTQWEMPGALEGPKRPAAPCKQFRTAPRTSGALSRRLYW